MEDADLCLLVVDGSVPLSSEDRAIAQTLNGRPAILVASKADLPPALSDVDLRSLLEGARAVRTSVPGSEGLEELQSAVVETVLSGEVAQSDDVLVSNPRHKEILIRAETALRDAFASMDAGLPADCTSSDIRAAVDALGEITGETATEDLLEAIFSHFCIGK